MRPGVKWGCEHLPAPTAPTPANIFPGGGGINGPPAPPAPTPIHPTWPKSKVKMIFLQLNWLMAIVIGYLDTYSQNQSIGKQSDHIIA